MCGIIWLPLFGIGEDSSNLTMPKNQNYKRLSCFVGMRIDDKETDAVYDRLIKPAIKAVGLIPRRIDRVKHNDRIDQQILREMQSCHLMISDLTYARPSVYWEAGFVEGRQVPVIYTCRKDHFSPRPDDENGNYRVHFDLQTKKIIPWGSPKDRTFAIALERQLKYVMRPLLLQATQAERLVQEEAAFASYSMLRRRLLVLDHAKALAKRLGFTVKAVDLNGLIGVPKVADALSRSYTMFFATLTRDKSKSLLTANLMVLSNLKKDFFSALNRWTYSPLDRERSDRATKQGKLAEEHYIIVSFGSIATSVINETLPHFNPASTKDSLVWSATVTDPSRREILVHVLSNVKSESQACERIRQVLLNIR